MAKVKKFYLRRKSDFWTQAMWLGHKYGAICLLFAYSFFRFNFASCFGCSACSGIRFMPVCCFAFCLSASATQNHLLLMHLFVGNFGHLLVIVAFVTALLAAFSYYKARKSAGTPDYLAWKRFARAAFLLHGLSVFGVIAALFHIIQNHYYEYHYAWSHSSNNLPAHFMISCFWEGQEGSFLLWIFWHVLLGFVLIRTAKDWEPSVMQVFSVVQAFLVSMILGVVVFELKIGSSPFILLRDALDAPIFQVNPDFIPEDGTGLNPLLQNYWMVIHPPMVFLGFAATLVPFAFAIAGLQTQRFGQWVKPALSWAHFAALSSGLGIVMGAYWAYETLNFGGYWNWDPVENAVYIPWLVLIAALHTMALYQNKRIALKTSMILAVCAFVLVLYATFLTRSGVLGEASVHSFTDLGLSGQLLIYLCFFAAYGFGLIFFYRKKIPAKPSQATIYTREFWIFAATTVLCLSAFQILVPTSIPVYNAFLGFFGIISTAAPPADQVVFYTKYQLWFGVVIALLSGTAQFFWWQKMKPKRLLPALTYPIIFTLLLSAIIIAGAKITDWRYIVLLTASVYALVANLLTLLKIGRKKPKLAGGALAHTGIALMLIGILFSSGYSETISLNLSGRPWSSDFSETMNKKNLLLFRNQTRQMQNYQLTYRGPRLVSPDIPGYIYKEDLLPTPDPYKKVATKPIVQQGTTYAKTGDTVYVYHENVYYEVEYRKNDGQVFYLYPRVQTNPSMGAVPSPGIRRTLSSDLYTHITNLAVDDQEIEWSEATSYQIKVGDTLILNDYISILDNITRVEKVIGTQLEAEDIAVKAHFRVLALPDAYDLKPVFIIKNEKVGKQVAVNRDLGLKISFDSINPENGALTFSVSTTQKDWIIINAMRKPWINLLWLGTLLMTLGFGIAAYRRYSDRKSAKIQPANTPKTQVEESITKNI